MLRNQIFHAGSKGGISPLSKPKSKNNCLKPEKVSYKTQFLVALQCPAMLNDWKNLAHPLRTVFSSWRNCENNLCDKINPCKYRSFLQMSPNFSPHRFVPVRYGLRDVPGPSQWVRKECWSCWLTKVSAVRRQRTIAELLFV